MGVVTATAVPVEIVGLLVSPVHAYEGRPQFGARPDLDGTGPDCVEVRAGLGLVGDRYFGRAAHRRAAVTLFAAESLDEIAAELGLSDVPDPELTRRNVVLRGFPVDQLATGRGTDGATFSLDCGDGPVRFRAHRPANPCRWMDVMLAPGAFRAMRGRGGVRCEPLDDGVLRLGPAVLRVDPPDQTR
ncbi:MOSC domain-containing protein [Pseudonocardia sp.]|jgi:MOSC domain-containing protein YiiM|uniref:MOSC domain-containing protein n=1 Tax=Pseudonocardia sp. TaxID=60912 RepID=UPI0031FE1CF7